MVTDQIAGGSVLPQAFLSYAHTDDQGLDGAITWLKNELETTYHLLTGRKFTIFQDRNDIEFGQNWAACLDNALERSRFLIPILTPSYFTSNYCRTEAEKFMGSEKTAGRSDLILPIYLIEAEVLEKPELCASDSLAAYLRQRQRSDWRDPDMQWRTNAGIRQKINNLARQIDKAVQRVAVLPIEPVPTPVADQSRNVLPTKLIPAVDARDEATAEPPDGRSSAEISNPEQEAYESPRSRRTGVAIGAFLAVSIIAAAVGVGVWNWTTHLAIVDSDKMLALEEAQTRLSTATAELDLVKGRFASAEAELAATAASVRESGATFRDCLDCPKMVIIPFGDFIMGSDAGKGERDEQPAHPVTIDKNFAIGVYEVTFAEWDACVADGGCEHRPDDEGWSRGDPKMRALLPVINVNWYDAQDYVTWLSEKTGQRYRLPSEAEWEYAARGGAATRYFWGDQAIGCKYANGADMTYKRVSDVSSQAVAKCEDGFAYVAPVGSFEPNPFGVHDTAGNVSEWVEDHKSDDYQGVPLDGSVHLDPGKDYNHRVIRGGDWSKRPDSLRSANRLQSERTSQENVNGIRVVRDLRD